MSESAISKTTIGGCAFEELCRGTAKSYACDNLIDLTKEREESTGPWTLSRATKALIKHIRASIRSIEIERDHKVEQFYIGKTHVQRRPGLKFNHMKRSTWKLASGINGRFRTHRANGYGRDGLVVLTVVTREAIPPNIRRNRKRVNQEIYALALESKLIHHFLIKRDDRRIVNPSTDPGRKVNEIKNNKKVTRGYPLYMAYKVKDPAPESDSNCSRSGSCGVSNPTTVQDMEYVHHSQYTASNDANTTHENNDITHSNSLDLSTVMTMPSTVTVPSDRNCKPRHLNLTHENTSTLPGESSSETVNPRITPSVRTPDQPRGQLPYHRTLPREPSKETLDITQDNIVNYKPLRYSNKPEPLTVAIAHSTVLSGRGRKKCKHRRLSLPNMNTKPVVEKKSSETLTPVRLRDQSREWQSNHQTPKRRTSQATLDITQHKNNALYSNTITPSTVPSDEVRNKCKPRHLSMTNENKSSLPEKKSSETLTLVKTPDQSRKWLPNYRIPKKEAIPSKLQDRCTGIK